jgi:hypothetical protein
MILFPQVARFLDGGLGSAAIGLAFWRALLPLAAWAAGVLVPSSIVPSPVPIVVVVVVVVASR